MGKTIGEQSTDLRIATFRLARRLRAEKADGELSDAHFSVLAGLHKHGEETLSALAEREGVSAPSMNRTVNSLEEWGYVERISDERDRRKVIVALTDSGHDTVKNTVKKRDRWLHQQLRGLSSEDRATLFAASELMRRLATQ
ncbi:MarR family winged helix-turn-helix transcriptional regulator [Paramicrobacterium agarici]|uniref:DNA-binding MarR family transcriptional regulator n=1 Tax=Paramicrobacterium agarici TaxID=630514 RepID=A0A2A9DTM4_9MICO|nr:MarR family transcriptional regulator [Microbacterium agarici]PFG29322.1 DNA-binding MarR family transcriptional regulator [Microbacterium agarici]TQO22324.1 DNA-binding MarR family transcriptional regulator [Microbacterium agarici]